MNADALVALASEIAAAVPGAAQTLAFGEITLQVAPAEIVATLTALRDHPVLRFTTLIDICGADYPERAQRFDVVYHLLSMRRNAHVRVKLQTGEMQPVPTPIGVYPASSWFEREAFDMYGILFSDHPALRRMLTDYGFSGHPLRKDFPLTGYVEVCYDDEQKRVVYEPVKLQQEFRSFDYLSPWEGARAARPLPGDEKAKTP